MNDDGGGWRDYQKLVLAELAEHGSKIDKVSAEINRLHVEIATLKVKSGVWGAVAGALPAAIAIAWTILR